MKFIILAALCCFVLVINAATVPLTETEISRGLAREKRSPFLLAALGAAGLVGAGILGLTGAATLGAKAGFAAGALAGSAARSYSSGSYYYDYGYRSRFYDPTDYEYKAEVRERV